MRPRYPISKKENEIELMELQEHLICLLGVDNYPHDGVVEVSGVYDTTDKQLTDSVSGFLGNRLVDSTVSPDGSNYRNVYGAVTRLEVGRRIHGQ